MAIFTYKQTCECISLQIFQNIQFENHGIAPTPPPDLPTLKAHSTPSVGGRFGIFSLKWRERMNLKVPGAILPLGCAILSTRAKTVRGVGTTPLGELGLSNVLYFLLLKKVILYRKLTAHNCQKRTFLKCPCHNIYWEEAVSLKKVPVIL